MAISRRHLNEGEHPVLVVRTHAKALLVPAVVLVVLAAAVGFLSALPGGRTGPVLLALIWGGALVAALWWVVQPFLRWLMTTYTLTDRRLISSTGVLTRRGQDIWLHAVNDVAYEHGLVDRLLGCGTLVISDASEHGSVVLHDIPRVRQVQLQVNDLLHRGWVGRSGVAADGTEHVPGGDRVGGADRVDGADRGTGGLETRRLDDRG